MEVGYWYWTWVGLAALKACMQLGTIDERNEMHDRRAFDGFSSNLLVVVHSIVLLISKFLSVACLFSINVIM